MKTEPELDSEIRTDEALAALFAKASSRPRPPAERESQIRERVHAVWQNRVRQKQQRRYRNFAMAASLAVAAVIGMLLYEAPVMVNGEYLATVEKRFGELHITDASGVPYYPAAGRFGLAPGQSVSTEGKAGLAMTWSNGSSLRLDEYTTISLASANEIHLQRGRIYIDSRPDSASPEGAATGNRDVLTVQTDRGQVTPLGTRYVTQLMNDKLIVMVREGEVAVTSREISASAMEGERLLLSDDQAPAVSPVPAWGEEWHWIEKTTPAWNAEGRTIHEFLGWVSRESGRPVRFESGAAEALARTELLVGYGQVELEPSEALRVVLMTTDLDWTIKDGTIVVTERRRDGVAGSP
jgi:ferric-dicitrate binding protein FerR (iron transport regulator)